MARFRLLFALVVCFGLIIAGITTAGASPRSEQNDEKKKEPRITWSVARLETTVAAGQQATVSATFTSNVALQNVSVNIPGMLGKITKASPAQFANVAANTPTTVVFTITMPAQRREAVAGVVELRAAKRALPLPLHVRVKAENKPQPTPKPTPQPTQTPGAYPAP